MYLYWASRKIPTVNCKFSIYSLPTFTFTLRRSVLKINNGVFLASNFLLDWNPSALYPCCFRIVIWCTKYTRSVNTPLNYKAKCKHTTAQHSVRPLHVCTCVYVEDFFCSFYRQTSNSPATRLYFAANQIPAASLPRLLIEAF